MNLVNASAREKKLRDKVKQIQRQCPSLESSQFSSKKSKRSKTKSKVELSDFFKTKIACILGKESLVDLLPFATKGFAEKGETLFSLNPSNNS